jgi:hypothetical protein
MDSGKKEILVNAGCLLFMPDGCTDRLRQDVQDLTLYTQLAATKRHSRFTASDRWRETWLAAMVRFGWVLKSHESRSLPAAELGAGSVWQWIRSQLPRSMPADVIRQTGEAARRSVLTLPDQPGIELYARNVLEPSSGLGGYVSVQGQKVLLQLGFFATTTGLSVITVEFTLRQQAGSNVLFEALAPGDIVGNVELTFHSMHLMDLVYAQFRETLAAALNDRRAALMCPLLEVGDE